MLNKFIPVLVFIPVLYFIGWIGSLKISEINAPQYKIAVRGYDPRDLLSGHYLSLRPDWKKTDCGQFPQNRCPEDVFQYSYRYYVPEQAAPVLEKMLQNGKHKTELLFVWPKYSNPRIKNLLIDNKPWNENELNIAE
ncbi:MAG: hypothetical protein KHX55_05220 [Proteobacteria bacterium]|nr:hypothetical protein [Pseudomonadota bacterium]